MEESGSCAAEARARICQAPSPYGAAVQDLGLLGNWRHHTPASARCPSGCPVAGASRAPCLAA
eukprot:9112629-Alexandrium_andersonii.AAC.1